MSSHKKGPGSILRKYMKDPIENTKVRSVNSEKDIALSIESLDLLFDYWQDPKGQLDWNCLFTTPFWLKTWWTSFGTGRKLNIYAVRQGDMLIGIAPLIIEGERAFLMGDSDLTDYVDFILVSGKEKHFFSALFDHLRQEHINCLDMGRVRADLPLISELKSHAESLRYDLFREPAELLYKMELPGTWEEYLALLSGKKRHEVRRKLRRLHDAGDISFRVVEKKESVHEAMNIFIELFRMNRSEKDQFMSDAMESFFRLLANSMAEGGLLKLFFLDVNDIPVAAAMCFDYHSTMYLYNSGYDLHYRQLSPGLLCKVFSIRHSIQLRRKVFDFLKGDESYKHRLGGSSVQLYHCWVILK